MLNHPGNDRAIKYIIIQNLDLAEDVFAKRTEEDACDVAPYTSNVPKKGRKVGE
jgi:hypothetical protein